ncbi:MAG: nucleotidyltransferase domain-containing protein [Chloroflexota bacterium]|nr:nucleotidyltransferase domain-containing protein [Chloroflexota bacterium]
MLGLDAPEATITQQFERDGREMDLATHDIAKFLNLLLKKNGNVLEQIYSPLVVQGEADLEELRVLARGAITRHFYHHYAGFARNKLKEFDGESPRRVKTLLYVFRVLLTGIWLLQTGEVEANLLHLNRMFRLPFIPDLVAQKSKERAMLDESDLPVYREAIASLQTQLESAFADTTLPDAPVNRGALNDFLVRIRLEYDRD